MELILLVVLTHEVKTEWVEGEETLHDGIDVARVSHNREAQGWSLCVRNGKKKDKVNYSFNSREKRKNSNQM